MEGSFFIKALSSHLLFNKRAKFFYITFNVRSTYHSELHAKLDFFGRIPDVSHVITCHIHGVVETVTNTTLTTHIHGLEYAPDCTFVSAHPRRAFVRLVKRFLHLDQSVWNTTRHSSNYRVLRECLFLNMTWIYSCIENTTNWNIP